VDSQSFPWNCTNFSFGYPELTVPCGDAGGGADAGHDATLLGTQSSQLDPSKEGTFELLEAMVQVSGLQVLASVDSVIEPYIA
jgi:hypothetical protein